MIISCGGGDIIVYAIKVENIQWKLVDLSEYVLTTILASCRESTKTIINKLLFKFLFSVVSLRQKEIID